MSIDEKVQREFADDLLAFRDSCGISDGEFAGMLIGAGATMAAHAGLTKGQMITVASKSYDIAMQERAANDG